MLVLLAVLVEVVVREIVIFMRTMVINRTSVCMCVCGGGGEAGVKVEIAANSSRVAMLFVVVDHC